jgi:hypothetical protein
MTGTVDMTKRRHDVVTTDNTAWHSGGITGITTYATLGQARRGLARLLAWRPEYAARAGKGAFIRATPAGE